MTTVDVTPPSAAPFMGDTLLLTATVKDQHGAVMAGKTVVWSSGNPALATVDATGRVIALTPGSVTITAAVEARSGAAVITVAGPGTEGGASGTALVGPQGGSVLATLPGGGTLSLSIPAGALSAPVQVTLDPVVPSGGSQAAFRISPGGLRLTQPATLVVKVSPGAKVRSTTVLVFEQDGRRIPVPGTPNIAAGTVTVSLTLLGLPATAAVAGAALRIAPGRGPSTTAPPANGNLLNLEMDQRLADATAALQQLQALGTPPAADAMQLAMEAVVILDQAAVLADFRFISLALQWRVAVCASTDFAFNALRSFGFVSDYRGLARVAGAVIGWSQAAGQVAAFLSQLGQSPGCVSSVPDAEAEITGKLSSMQAAIQADLQGFALLPNPRDSLFVADRITPLIDLIASLQLVSFDQAAQILLGLVPPQIDRIRGPAYGQCLLNHSQEMQGRLMRSEAAGGVFTALSSFDVAALEEDIELCGMTIDWRVLDSTGTSVGGGSVGGGGGPGSVLPLGSKSLTGPGQLELSGFLHALLCPSPASANAEQLEVAAGLTTQALTRVAVLSPSNQNDYLAVSPLLISDAVLRSAAGVAPDATAVVKVVIRRIGELCSGLFANLQHSTLGTLTLTLAPSPELCPSPVVGGALLGNSGTAHVCLPPPPIVFTFDDDLEGWSPGVAGPNSGANWGTVFRISDRVKMDGTGGPGQPNAWISRTIAIPLNATILSFDVSGHDRAGADARLTVRIVDGGVSSTLLTQIVTGAAGTLTFSSRQLNISAWAGKTVQIFFEQDDNGFGGGPGQHEQVYLDNISIRP